MPLEMGPILRFETRRFALRKGWYVWRVVFCMALLALLGMYHRAFWWNVSFGVSPAWAKRFLAETLTIALALIHLSLAFVIAPIAAADAFNRQRVRTMLPSVLVTELTTRRIVCETFAASLFPVISTWLCLVPIAAFLVPLWGIDPTFFAIMEGVTFSSILLCVATTIAFSLWSGRTFHTLLGVYGLSGWLLVLGFSATLSPGPSWIARANPYFLLVAGRWSASGPVTLADCGLFMGAAALLTIALLVLVTATFRRVVLAPPRSLLKKVGVRSPALRAAWAAWPGWLPGPTLDGNPVLWREWRRQRASLGARAFWILYILGASVATVLGVHAFWGGQFPPDLVAVIGFGIGIGLLAAAVRAGFAWSEEKGAGRIGLDLLLVAPLSARVIVMGKWWGAYRDVLLVAVLPTVSTVIVAAGAPPRTLPWIDRVAVPAVVLGQVLVYGAAVVSLGLYFSTRLARSAAAGTATALAFLVVTFIVPAVSEMVFLRLDRILCVGLGTASPVGGPIATTMSLFSGPSSPYFISTRNVLPFALAWLCVAGFLAWLLARSTIRRFDAWMGRMP